MKSMKTVKQAYIFLGLTLAFSWFVFWGPLVLFKIPTISFVSDVKGPWWAIALYLTGGFVPSLLAIFLTWKKEFSIFPKQHSAPHQSVYRCSLGSGILALHQASGANHY